MILLGIETFTGGFFVFFFALAAGLLALLLILSIDLSLETQAWLFGILSFLGMILFRRYLVGKSPNLDIDSLIGTSAFAINELAPGEQGKVESRGSTWEAKNVGTEPITHECKVVGLDGLKLMVKK